MLLSFAALAAGVEVRVLSSRADMVTGGDALLETNATLEKFNAKLNGQDVTRSFRPGKTPGTLIARVEGLKIGKNTLEVKSAKGRAKLELTNYPLTGPVLSGPHQSHSCARRNRPAQAPADGDCSAKTIVIYVYKSTQPPHPVAAGSSPGALPGRFKPFDPRAASADGADHDQRRRTVDYIVRRGEGHNHAIYEIAFLPPGQPLPDP
jgi:hypothetical protein